MSFRDFLDSSQAWEDARLLRRSLAIEPDDHVLTVGSAGCNILELLLEDPKKITVIDLAPAQHALLDLRFRAIEHLDYDSYLILLGVESSPDVIPIYRRLRSSLHPETRDYFDANEQLLSLGLIHQGRLEKHFQDFRSEALWKVWSEDFRQKLIQSKTLKEQAEWIYKNGQLEKLKDFSMAYYQRHFPVAPDDVTTSQRTCEKLFVKLVHVLQSHLIRDNPYLYYFITGEVPPPQQRIDSLKPELFQTLKERISRVSLLGRNFEAALQAIPAGSVQKLNLSHLFESFEPSHCKDLFVHLHEKLSERGRLAYWTSSSSRRPPAAQFQQSKPLVIKDRVWFYKDYYIFDKKS